MRLAFKNTIHEEQEVGEIVIGSFSEEFLSAVGTWGKIDYIRHWHNRVISALQGCDVCFIVDWRGPANPYLIGPVVYEHEFIWGQMWVLYWVGNNNAVLQNHLIILDYMPPHPNDMPAGERETESEDAAPVSEWAITRLDIENLKNQLEYDLANFNNAQ